MEEKSASFGFEQHDHNLCLSKAIQAAEDYCTKYKLQFTPLRRKVLELLLQEHRALGAYAILDLLRDAGFSSQPPVAYRALSFLVEHGFAHKIERLNAFVNHLEKNKLVVNVRKSRGKDIDAACGQLANKH